MQILHEYRQGRKWVVSLPFEADFLEVLEQFAEEKKIKVGHVGVIGAVKKAVVAFYDQDKKKYETLTLDEPLEILHCTGNLSLKDGNAKAHLHIIFGRYDGTAIGGHLMPGTIVFAAETVIEELLGAELHRGFDAQTGLPLWKE